MAREKGDMQHTDKGKIVGKQQLYALLVNAAGAPVLDDDGNTQVVEVGAEADGKLKINTSGLATQTTLATLLTQSEFNSKADITLSALRDALKGSGEDLKTLHDLYTQLGAILGAGENTKTLYDLYTLINGGIQLSGSNPALIKEIVGTYTAAGSATMYFGGTHGGESTGQPLNIIGKQRLWVYIENNTDKNYPTNSILLTNNMDIGSAFWRMKLIALPAIAAGGKLLVSAVDYPDLDKPFIGIAIKTQRPDNVTGTFTVAFYGY